MKKQIRAYPQLNVIKEIWRGKTLTRSLFNASIRNYELTGKVLDLGAKSQDSGYYTRIQNNANQIVMTDLQDGPNVTFVDVEEKFPFEDNTFDCVISAHLFEHVQHFQRSAREIDRVLKPGGQFLICLPFHYHYHPDPQDYFRFTLDGILATWGGKTSLRAVQVEYLGPGIMTNQLSPILDLVRTKILKMLIVIPAYITLAFIDLLIDKARSYRQGRKPFAETFAIEHILIFKKC